ncbi:MAG: DUF47 family protein [Bacteroidetes bacterium]|nr:DUF47 family protein [Bacteroidota bacterium]
MSFFNRIQSYILPKEIDFFQNLIKQSQMVLEVIQSLEMAYAGTDHAQALLLEKLKAAEILREQNLMELNDVLITPIDKEAISRAYLNLDWILLSVKHLDVEIRAYQIHRLEEYANLFRLLSEEAKQIPHCFDLLKQHKFDQVIKLSKEIIALDDELIHSYSGKVSKLLEDQNWVHVMKHKEILSQIKEISKRMHVCANTIEDFVFKMN